MPYRKRGKISSGNFPSHIEVVDFNENPNVGVYCRTNEDVAYIQKGLLKKIKKIVSSVLQIDLIELTIAEGSIIGSLLTMNSYGAVVTDLADSGIVKILENQGLMVLVVEDVLNAAGNDILTNDKGALVHPDFAKKTVEKIHETLGVPVHRGTIASLKTVGMAAVVTNKGLLCHPKVTPEEKRRLEKIFGVSVMIGTVNHGVPLIGSGIIANSKGAIIGNLTTGIELGRIEEALNLLEK